MNSIKVDNFWVDKIRDMSSNMLLLIFEMDKFGQKRIF